MDQQTRLALSQLAANQRGLFSAAQAARLGIGPRQLTGASAKGYLRRARLGVYAIEGTPPSRWEYILAAALAAGPDAVISHSSAAAIHRLHGGRPGAAEITMRSYVRLRLAGVITHRTLLLPDADLVTRYGVTITSPVRTLVDMAALVAPAFLERMVDEGLIARRSSVADLVTGLDRAAVNAPGRGRLEQALQLRNESPSAESVLEARVYAALKPLAPYEAHFVLAQGTKIFVLDAAWPDRLVGAEVVGRDHRVASRSAFDRERRKLNVLAAAGWRVAHLTAAMSTEEITSSVRALLGTT
jgi:hypothetical protein